MLNATKNRLDEAFRAMEYLPLVLALLVPMSTTGLAQSPSSPPPPPEESLSADLTEGLLDLLKEPAAEPMVPPATDVPSQPSTQPGAPTEGEDLGPAPEHPLVPVKQRMTQLATWLRQGAEPEQSAQVRRDLIGRLDALIAQLEQQPAANQPSSSAASGSDPSRPTKSAAPDQRLGKSGENASAQAGGQAPLAGDGLPGQSPAKEQAPRPDPSQPGPGDQPTGRDRGGDGQPGTPPIGNRTAIVELNDPTALQRSAWGNLPQRIREQMQSRMVERFLPGYREEIEAYYRALSK